MMLNNKLGEVAMNHTVRKEQVMKIGILETGIVDQSIVSKLI